MHSLVRTIALRPYPRVVCISDIHGELALLQALLQKAAYAPGRDALVLLGDLCLKGAQPLETLRYILGLSAASGVFILRGNCDFAPETWLPGITPAEAGWLDALPVILDAEGYTFVHAGLRPGRLEEQDIEFCVRNDAFMERGFVFDKWVVTGHWPVNNYCHGVVSCDPMVNPEQRIIAIDGGNVIKSFGQLNAFIIENGAFSWQSADKLEAFAAPRDQAAAGGFNITWGDRFVKALESRGTMTRVRHLASGRDLWLPTGSLWRDEAGNLIGATCGTDYFLPVKAGETLKRAAAYPGRVLAKRGSTVGWVMLP